MEDDRTISLPPCPRCGAAHVVRNGLTHSGTRPSGAGLRPAVRRHPEEGRSRATTKDLIRRLLGERMSLRAIARVTGVSRSWLQGFVNALFREDTPHDPGPLQKSPAGW